MNRENKRKLYEKVTIKHILAKTVSPVKYADARSYRPEQAATTEITALIVFPACIWILSRGIEKLIVVVLWIQ